MASIPDLKPSPQKEHGDNRKLSITGASFTERRVWPDRQHEKSDTDDDVSSTESSFTQTTQMDVIQGDCYSRIDNISVLGDVDEKTLCAVLENRFNLGIYYTFVGKSLITINPGSSHKNTKKIEEHEEISLYNGYLIDDFMLSKEKLSGQISERFKGMYQQPHAHAVAEDAILKMFMHQKNQHLMILGDSGSGKTTIAKAIVGYISSRLPYTESKISGSRTIPTFGDEIEPRTSCRAGARYSNQESLKSRTPSPRDSNFTSEVTSLCNLMEAFGNAKTTNNGNSSRFILQHTISYNYKGEKINWELHTNLLEVSRITNKCPEESNFHIFYDIANEADAKDHAGGNEYAILRETQEVKGASREELRKDYLKHFVDCGLDNAQAINIRSHILAILDLGNLEFVEQAEELQGCKISDDTRPFLIRACNFVGWNQESIEKLFTTRQIRVGKDKTTAFCSVKQAKQRRDSLMKMDYKRLFDFIIEFCSQKYKRLTIGSKNKEQMLKKDLEDESETQSGIYSIGISDVFGFEIVKHCGFEQLLINYFSECLLAIEREERYRFERKFHYEEGAEISVELTNLMEESGKDSSVITEIFKVVFATLKEQNTLNSEPCDIKNQDASIIHRMRQDKFTCRVENSVKKFEKELKFISLENYGLQKNNLIVKHSCGVVEYNLENWLEKNINMEILEFDSLIRSLKSSSVLKFPNSQEKCQPGKKKEASFLHAMMTENLNDFRRLIKDREIRSIKCLKSVISEDQRINSEQLLSQIKCSGTFNFAAFWCQNWSAKVDYNLPLAALLEQYANADFNPKEINLKSMMNGYMQLSKMRETLYEVGLTRIFFKPTYPMGEINNFKEKLYDGKGLERIIHVIKWLQKYGHLIKKSIYNRMLELQKILEMQLEAQKKMEMSELDFYSSRNANEEFSDEIPLDEAGQGKGLSYFFQEKPNDMDAENEKKTLASKNMLSNINEAFLCIEYGSSLKSSFAVLQVDDKLIIEGFSGEYCQQVADLDYLKFEGSGSCPKIPKQKCFKASNCVALAQHPRFNNTFCFIDDQYKIFLIQILQRKDSALIDDDFEKCNEIPVASLSDGKKRSMNPQTWSIETSFTFGTTNYCNILNWMPSKYKELQFIPLKIRFVGFHHGIVAVLFLMENSVKCEPQKLEEDSAISSLLLYEYQCEERENMEPFSYSLLLVLADLYAKKPKCCGSLGCLVQSNYNYITVELQRNNESISHPNRQSKNCRLVKSTASLKNDSENLKSSREQTACNRAETSSDSVRASMLSTRTKQEAGIFSSAVKMPDEYTYFRGKAGYSSMHNRRAKAIKQYGEELRNQNLFESLPCGDGFVICTPGLVCVAFLEWSKDPRELYCKPDWKWRSTFTKPEPIDVSGFNFISCSAKLITFAGQGKHVALDSMRMQQMNNQTVLVALATAEMDIFVIKIDWKEVTKVKIFPKESFGVHKTLTSKVRQVLFMQPSEYCENSTLSEAWKTSLAPQIPTFSENQTGEHSETSVLKVIFENNSFKTIKIYNNLEGVYTLAGCDDFLGKILFPEKLRKKRLDFSKVIPTCISDVLMGVKSIEKKSLEEENASLFSSSAGGNVCILDTSVFSEELMEKAKDDRL